MKTYKQIIQDAKAKYCIDEEVRFVNDIGRQLQDLMINSGLANNTNVALKLLIDDVDFTSGADAEKLQQIHM